MLEPYLLSRWAMLPHPRGSEVLTQSAFEHLSLPVPRAHQSLLTGVSLPKGSRRQQGIDGSRSESARSMTGRRRWPA